MRGGSSQHQSASKNLPCFTWSLDKVKEFTKESVQTAASPLQEENKLFRSVNNGENWELGWENRIELGIEEGKLGFYWKLGWTNGIELGIGLESGIVLGLNWD